MSLFDKIADSAKSGAHATRDAAKEGFRSTKDEVNSSDATIGSVIKTGIKGIGHVAKEGVFMVGGVAKTAVTTPMNAGNEEKQEGQSSEGQEVDAEGEVTSDSGLKEEK